MAFEEEEIQRNDDSGSGGKDFFTAEDDSEKKSKKPSLEDKEIREAKKQLEIKMLRLKYYQEVAKTIGVFLQSFRNEALSLVSGITVIVAGWFQVKKVFLAGKKEVKDIQNESRSEVKPHFLKKHMVSHQGRGKTGLAETKTSSGEATGGGMAKIEVKIPGFENTWTDRMLDSVGVHTWILLASFILFGYSSLKSKWIRHKPSQTPSQGTGDGNQSK